MIIFQNRATPNIDPKILHSYGDAENGTPNFGQTPTQEDVALASAVVRIPKKTSSSKKTPAVTCCAFLWDVFLI